MRFEQETVTIHFVHKAVVDGFIEAKPVQNGFEVASKVDDGLGGSCFGGDQWIGGGYVIVS